jgi:cytidylate kinase
MDIRKHIITIAGRPASGKSTAAKAIAQTLGYQHFSSGDLFRALGRERGMDVLQTNLSAGKGENTDIDALVDERLRQIGQNEDEVVVDSRTAWHWMPNSYKVFLDLDLKMGAERILAAMTEDRLKTEHIPDDPEIYAQTLNERLASETRRYRRLYDIDPYQMDNYDLVIDTAVTSKEETLQRILDGYRAWLSEAE